jgi:hypothetical protein
MKKGNSVYKMLTGLTLVFVLIAAFSFAAFQPSGSNCISELKKCTQQIDPAQKGGEMLWDGFSRRFVSLMILK